ncbi:MAG: hypothetical protein RQ891_05360 [Thermoflexus sp.]|jgi:hypothetical protein|uniref:Uncharacterized protein n=1 Tax=Thermoflexus hugenholtzii JAD2 TaxID=877466 RepID=A0A212REC6_9CHLR|nr:MULTISPECIES: hypothetical protein [Thermoflexus]MDT7884265.1 hypothetical protein [Thermoflexus sp.]MDT7947914.1 hypothetical protein [Thermoflexus sp.]QWK09764.1 MAG: hypothetical protein KNN16_10330 [Thermoflexus hugenholtzii]SNB70469.1 hypothetical protein SAMN02746019_00012430 [Thermoflexus hugenholtzii JAD2]
METVVQIDERLRQLREELTRMVRNGEDEEGLRLRRMLAELERLEALRRELRAWRQAA